jgi:lipopolysaccharide/colanic/teichoic acid biosynthesis glycosyltransferase
MLKYVFDMVVSAAVLICVLPLMLLIAIAIRVDSRGSVLYRGERIGRYGKKFKMYKFRTMVVDAERMGGTSTGRNDPRITRLGRVLRAYKLDELPQLFNVLRGEMSLVGPRPEVEEYTRLYDEEQQVILTIRPGITDYSSIEFANLAEVIGDHEPDRVFAQTVLPVKNALRVRYVRERSFAKDLQILVRTVGAIFRRR